MAKVCQDGRKALMTNPNKDLGRWILRDKLNLEPGRIITLQDLINKQIDSVKIEKLSGSEYRISIHQSIRPGQQNLNL